MMNDDNITALAKRISDDQQIPLHEAVEDAKKILTYDVAIVDAARAYAVTGAMPQTPVIAGKSPLALNKEYYPTQVFSVLQALQKNPEQTMRGLRHFPGRKQFGPDKLPSPPPRIVDDEHFLGLMDEAAIIAHLIYDDAVAVPLPAAFVSRLKEHYEMLERVTEEFEHAVRG